MDGAICKFGQMRLLHLLYIVQDFIYSGYLGRSLTYQHIYNHFWSQYDFTFGRNKSQMNYLNVCCNSMNLQDNWLKTISETNIMKPQVESQHK
ncbi:unnamed protein product [Paramecium octaurelia]|uniref:Uncharacterized protein n=1 Tax=Paramecium octaurelia TaxID=43137 RepID=A0A8S1X9W1_PAROT|nr:unnamed protein product [Paramecium octaurelia]